MKKKNQQIFKERVKLNLLRIALVGFTLLAWELMVRYKLLDPFYISQPSRIFLDLVQLFWTGEIFPHLMITFKEAFLGLILGTFLGMFAGFVLGRIELLAKLLDPVITAVYGIPKIALGPLFILWFGLGITSKIFLSLWAVFFLIFFNTYAGFRSVDPVLTDTVKLMGANEHQIMRQVVIPSCAPWIFAGLRASLGASLLGAIIGEYLGATAGLGWMIEYAGGMFETTRVLSCTLILMGIVILLRKGLETGEKYFLKWRPASNQTM